VTSDDVFQRVLGILERAAIPYMLTGSFAGAYHGAPRATQDIDVVADPTLDQLRTLIALLPAREYYVDEAAALEAQRQHGQFNIIDLETGWKVDIIIRKDRPFSQEEFDRREVVNVQGRQIAIATVEDVLIAKLEWAKLGQSQRQLEDVARILKVRVGEIDRPYVARWIRQLELAPQWDAACRMAGITAD
jgi:hypothetical protein